MFTALALAAVCAQQGVDMNNLPKIDYETPIMGGQRELILGPKQEDSTLLNGYYDRDVAAHPLFTPDNTGGYVESWNPGGSVEDSLGYFDCATKTDSLFNQACLAITTTAKWNQTIGRKPHQIKFSDYAKEEWWVTADGKILREYAMLQTPQGTQTADCAYGKDSIQRRYTGLDGQTSFGEIFPVCGMDALNDRFKPMLADGKLLMREKVFNAIDPLTGGMEKYTVRTAGTFKGNWLFAWFEGRLFDIEGPNKLFEKVFLDNTGDLVKVALTDEKYFVINVIPSSHLDENGHPITKHGG